MLRSLLPALLLALAAAPVAAQKTGFAPVPTPLKGASAPGVQSVKGPSPIQTPKRVPGGVYGAGNLVTGGAWLDPAYVASERARFERAKDMGQVCPLREAHIAKRLKAMEAQIAAQQKGQLKPFPTKTIQSAGTGKK